MVRCKQNPCYPLRNSLCRQSICWILMKSPTNKKFCHIWNNLILSGSAQTSVNLLKMKLFDKVKLIYISYMHKYLRMMKWLTEFRVDGALSLSLNPTPPPDTRFSCLPTSTPFCSSNKQECCQQTLKLYWSWFKRITCTCVHNVCNVTQPYEIVGRLWWWQSTYWIIESIAPKQVH